VFVFPCKEHNNIQAQKQILPAWSNFERCSKLHV